MSELDPRGPPGPHMAAQGRRRQPTRKGLETGGYTASSQSLAMAGGLQGRQQSGFGARHGGQPTSRDETDPWREKLGANERLASPLHAVRMSQPVGRDDGRGPAKVFHFIYGRDVAWAVSAKGMGHSLSSQAARLGSWCVFASNGLQAPRWLAASSLIHSHPFLWRAGEVPAGAQAISLETDRDEEDGVATSCPVHVPDHGPTQGDNPEVD